MINSRIRLAVVALLGACATPEPACHDATRIASLPDPLDEASGIAASRIHPETVWAINDSEGSPLLYALDHDARLLATLALPGAPPQSDWEDIATGPCPNGDCIYIGDIGDNLHDRDDHAILRLPEPDIAARTIREVERFPFRYPDEPEDAEAIFVTSDTVVYIVTKGRRSAVTLFRMPALRADSTVTLERVQQLTDGLVQLPDMITGADAMGDVIVLRSYAWLRFYRLDGDTLAAVDDARADLEPLAEPQGEGVAFVAPDRLLLVTERGPTRDTAPFLSQVSCTPP